MKRVQFLKPFIYCDEVTIAATDYLVTINANPQVEGYVNDAVFTALDDAGLVIDLDA